MAFANAIPIDIGSSNILWNKLLSVNALIQSGNDSGKFVINSGGSIFFLLFSGRDSEQSVAVVKTATKYGMASEIMGYEFARMLKVETPQARLIHSTSAEGNEMIEALKLNISEAERVGNTKSVKDTKSLLDQLELNKAVLLMSFIRGSSWLESSKPFEDHGEKIAEQLGKIMIFDMVIRNSDRLKCNDLGWGGNHGNLLFSSESSAIFCIDSSIPASIPSGKRQQDKDNYPVFISAITNNFDYVSNLLYEITGGRLGEFSDVDISSKAVGSNASPTPTVCAFRKGFLAAKEGLLSLKEVIRPIYLEFKAILDEIAAMVLSWDVNKADTLSTNSSSFSTNTESASSSIEGVEQFFSKKFSSNLQCFHNHAKTYPESEEGQESKKWISKLSLCFQQCFEKECGSGFYKVDGRLTIRDAKELILRLYQVLERIDIILKTQEADIN